MRRPRDLSWTLGIAIVAACADGGSPAIDDRDRFQSSEDGFSCVVPADWNVRKDRGAIILSSPENPRRTIAIRSLTLMGDGADAQVISATDTVLRSLPGVDDLVRRPFSGPMRGTEYQLTFDTGHAGRYARRHLLLTGKRHAFHVIETSPARVANDAVFVDLVHSLREES